MVKKKKKRYSWCRACHTSGHRVPLLFKYLSSHSATRGMGQKTRWSPAGTRICQCTHIHTRTNRAKKNETDGQIQMWETHMCPLCHHHHSDDNDGNPLLKEQPGVFFLASSLWNEQVAWGRVQGESRGPSADRSPLLPGWLLSHLGLPSRGLWLHFIASSSLLMSCISFLMSQASAQLWALLVSPCAPRCAGSFDSACIARNQTQSSFHPPYLQTCFLTATKSGGCCDLHLFIWHIFSLNWKIRQDVERQNTRSNHDVLGKGHNAS